MATAIFSGSFDPVTFGHIDIISRASKVFDQLIIGILLNRSKRCLFDLEERIEMLGEVTKQWPNIKIVSFDGLIVNYCEEAGADVIVRGIRSAADLEYELIMARTNKDLNPKIETMFFASMPEYSYVSSSAVREIASFGGSIERYVPETVRVRVEEKYRDAYH